MIALRLSAIGFCLLAIAGCSTWVSASGPARLGPPPPDIGRPLVENPSFADADGRYGLSRTNPILAAHLAGITPYSERLYLHRLRGPGGEVIEYRRSGSCCHFSTPNGVVGPTGLLDVYEVRYRGLLKPVLLYLNMFDPGTELRAPDGFLLDR